MSNTGTCKNCQREFSYSLIHSGFSDYAYAYCGTCGQTASMNGWSKAWPKHLPFNYGSIQKELEPYLDACECGGRFKADASPRCPHCLQTLSAEAATAYIERNAPGTAKGWRWQRNWNGLYAIVIEKRSVREPWKAS
jgi:hypothetical protein